MEKSITPYWKGITQLLCPKMKIGWSNPYTFQQFFF